MANIVQISENNATVETSGQLVNVLLISESTVDGGGPVSADDVIETSSRSFIDPLTKAELIEKNLDNMVVVKEASDFGVIDSTKVYFLDGIIDMGSTTIEIPSGGIYITGYNFNVSGLVSSSAGYTLFESPAGGSGDILFMDFHIDINGLGSRVYDILSDTGFNAIEVDRINYNNCSSLGEISGYRQGLETGTGRFGGTPDLTLSGTWLGGYFIETSIVRSIDAGSYSIYQAGVGFSMLSRFRSNQNIDLPLGVSFVNFIESNFPNPSTLQFDGCIISRNGVFNSSDPLITPNISSGSLSSQWSNNNGINNTFVGGLMNVSSEATTAVSLQGEFYDINGTIDATDLQHFASPSSGQLLHLGSSPVEYKVGGQLVIDSSQNDEVSLKVVIYRSSTMSFEDSRTVTRVIDRLQGGRDVAYFAVSDRITLNQGDYMKLQVANLSSTSDITVENDSFWHVEER